MLYTYRSIYLPIYLILYTYRSIYLPTCLIYLPIYLSNLLCIYLCTYLPTYLPIYLYVYLHEARELDEERREVRLQYHTGLVSSIQV
jgi:hypothetical protein